MKKRIPCKVIESFCVLFLFFHVAPAMSQTYTFSSLQDIWQYANQHSADIVTKQIDKQVADKSLTQAYGSLLPKAQVNGNITNNFLLQATLIPSILFNPNAQPGTFTSVRFGRQYNYVAIWTASLNILNSSDWYNIKDKKINQTIASLNIEKAKKDIYEQIASAYYTYRMMKETEKLATENTQTSEHIYTLSLDSYNHGTINQITLNNSLIQLKQSQSNEQQAVQNEEVALNNLKSILQIPLSDSIYIANPLSNDTLTNMIEPNFVTDPNISIAYQQMKLAENKLHASIAANLPTLAFQYQGSFQALNDRFLSSQNTNYIPSENYALQLSVPLFAGGNKFFQTQMSKLNYDRSKKQYDQVQSQISIQNENAYLQYRNSWIAFNQTKEILNLYQQNNDKATTQYEQGIISLDQRMKFYINLLQYQDTYLQALSSLLTHSYILQIKTQTFNP